jgi:hypothetical protein
MDATKFFEDAVPFFICRGLTAFLASRGVIHFSVEGQGAWTLHLGNLDAPISRGLVGRADLAVWYSTRAFEAFLEGTLVPREVVRAGEFVASGDVGLLVELGRVLAAPKNGLFGMRVGVA